MWLPWEWAVGLAALCLATAWAAGRPAPARAATATSATATSASVLAVTAPPMPTLTEPTVTLTGGAGRPFVRAMAVEAGVVMLLYALWIRAGSIDPFGTEGGLDRGMTLWRWQQALHLPPEYWLQRGPLANRWLIQASNLYYGGVHVPAMAVFLLWLFVRHRPVYERWRTTLVVTTAACLVVRYVPVAPPRFYPELGFVDTAVLYGQSVYGAPGTGVSGQMAAMPSIHVAWAVLIAIAMWRHARLRWVGPLHGAVTVWVVTNTANHWWLDGVVGVGFLAAAWWATGAVPAVLAGVISRRRVAPDRGARDPIGLGSRGSGS